MEDCIECGACCFSESDRHARVTGDDYGRLTDDETNRLVHFIGNQAFMKLARTSGVSHCAALKIANGKFLCQIYERRPQVCRDLERGGGACEAEREMKKHRTLPLV